MAKPKAPQTLTASERALAMRFAELFLSFEEAFGTYEIKTREAGGKMKGRAITHKRGPTSADFEAHLLGASAQDAMGLLPLRKDNTVFWAALDIDVKNINHARLESKIITARYPFIVCRSKSGGAHLYIFFKKGVSAAIVRERLADWSAELGYGGCEIFPKQSDRASPEDYGNWINMPYFGVFSKEGTNRYAVINGEAVDLKTFLDAAEKAKANFDSVKARALPKPEGNTLLYEAPPCLQYIHANGGFPEGTRNDGMFSVLVYLKKRFKENWESHLAEYNAEFAKPGLSHSEIMELMKSQKRKDYGYKCNDQPICAHCNKSECLTREYGIGETAKGVLEIGGMTRYTTAPGDPVRWGLEVAGRRIFVDNETLYSRDLFNRYCLGELSRIPVQISSAKWVAMLDDLAAQADIVELPADAGPTGLLWEHVEMFCLQKAQAKTLEEVWTGRPYNDGNKIYFRSVDLFTYLEQRRVDITRNKQRVFEILQSRGGASHPKKVGGRTMNLWVLPTPQAPELTKKAKKIEGEGTQEF